MIKGSRTVLMILSEYSSDFVTVLFLDIFCLLAFGDALSDRLTDFITYGTVLSRFMLRIEGEGILFPE
jgi:hypothetical protein